MPHWDALPRFYNDWHTLEQPKKGLFLTRLQEFIGVLKRWEAEGMPGSHPPFPAHLGIKSMAGRRNIWEFRWSGDGRATWSYGPPPQDGMCKIIWRRIGTHQIYNDP